MNKGPIKLSDLRQGKSSYEDDMESNAIQENLNKEYNFSKHKADTIAVHIKKYGNVHDAVFEMDAKIKSLQVEADSLREMIDWDDIEDADDEDSEE